MPPLEVCAAPLEAPGRHSEGKSLTEEGKKRLGTAGLRPQVRAQGEYLLFWGMHGAAL